MPRSAKRRSVGGGGCTSSGIRQRSPRLRRRLPVVPSDQRRSTPGHSAITHDEPTDAEACARRAITHRELTDAEACACACARARATTHHERTGAKACACVNAEARARARARAGSGSSPRTFARRSSRLSHSAYAYT